MPPVRRGDITKLCVEVSIPGVVAIADGTFHSYPSVGHEEIRIALEGGWKVYGLCSMGAIRASEMAHLGMIPFGEVARRFCTDPNFSDDEVCLIHSNEAPYFPMSEPLIHFRELLAALEARELVGSRQSQLAIQSLKCRWYGERTMQAFEIEMMRALDVEVLPELIRHELDDFQKFRLKQSDLLSFVSARAWEHDLE
jgi:hypothetical protein